MANILRCDACEYWQAHANMPSTGRCMLIHPINYSTDDDPPVVIMASDHAPAYLVTDGSWGCASWLAVDNDGPMDDDHYEDYLAAQERARGEA